MSRPRAIKISEEDRRTLEEWARSRSIDNATATRARIVLLTARGMTATAVAGALSVSARNVYKWVWRFDDEGIDGLKERHRSGRPRALDLDAVMEILRMTIEELPPGGTHWSLRLMAEATGVSKHQVSEIWEAAGLKPHRVKSFKISRDPQFAEKVVDVVGLYMNPPDNALVLSVDEKTQIQALDRTQPMLPLRPGQPERRTHDYKRHGTLSLYAALDVATGKVIDRVTKKHRAADFIQFLELIDRRTTDAPDVHLILDNSSTHKTPAVMSWLSAHPRFQVHFTPTSASWLNAVETWFSVLERRAVRRGVFTSVSDLRAAIKQFVEAHNRNHAKPFKWTKSAESILAAVERARAMAHQ